MTTTPARLDDGEAAIEAILLTAGNRAMAKKLRQNRLSDLNTYDRRVIETTIQTWGDVTDVDTDLARRRLTCERDPDLGSRE